MAPGGYTPPESVCECCENPRRRCTFCATAGTYADQLPIYITSSTLADDSPELKAAKAEIQRLKSEVHRLNIQLSRRRR